MKRYQKYDGESGVSGYEIGPDSITIQFQKGPVYLYNYKSTGATDIETMKRLAKSGRGLSTFISQSVGTRYALKLR